MGTQGNPELARIAVGAEAAALARDAAAAARLYEALRPHEGARVAGTEPGRPGGSVAYYLGLLARTAGRLEAAAAHLERALVLHAAAGEAGWTGRVRCELARVLLARGDERGRRQALAQLEAVLEWTADDGSPLGDEAAGLRARAALGQWGPANIFRCEGDVWTIVFGGRVSHVRDARGLHWLALLLREPGREFPVLTMEAPGEGTPGDPAAVERARVRVTRALRSAQERIAACHPALGRHLASTVRTGRVCAYVPDPRLPIEWTA